MVTIAHFCKELLAVVWCGVVWCGVVWCGVVWRREEVCSKNKKPTPRMWRRTQCRGLLSSSECKTHSEADDTAYSYAYHGTRCLCANVKPPRSQCHGNQQRMARHEARKPPRHVHERCSTPAGVDSGCAECTKGGTTTSGDSRWGNEAPHPFDERPHQLVGKRGPSNIQTEAMASGRNKNIMGFVPQPFVNGTSAMKT